MTTVYIEQRGAPAQLLYSLVFWPNFKFEISPKRLFLREIMEQYQEPFFTIGKRAEAAEFFAVPYEYFFVLDAHPDYLKWVFDAAKTAGKKVLLFDYTDYCDRVPTLPPHAVLFRVSAYRHHKRQNEIIMPYFVEDMGARFGISPKEKNVEPAVGYCGQSQFGSRVKALHARLKWFLHYVRLFLSGDPDPAVHRRGIFLRACVIARLSAGGVPLFLNERSFYALHRASAPGDPAVLRREYMENLREAGLALCVRGDANQSQRFYEALSAGRIPLLIDTDCVFPLEEVIDYNRVLLRVPLRRLRTLPARVHAWWECETSESFRARGIAAQKIFREYLRLDHFFAVVFDREQSPYRKLLYDSKY